MVGRNTDLNEAISISYKLRPTLAMQMYCDLNGVAPFPVKLVIDDEGDSNYFNSKTREIHLGVKFTYEYFKNDPDMPVYHDGHVDEARLLSALEYMLVHEESHVLYTGGESWNWAVRHCSEMAVEAVAKDVLKKPRTFRRSRDYDDALEDLRLAGFYLPVDMLSNVFNGVTNSMEDGRIERIAAGKNSKFAAQRTIWRHSAWNHNDNFESADLLDPSERLRIMLNGILSLATNGVFPKGFTTAYAGTDVLDELNSYVPAISEAYMASSTRDLAAAEFKLFPKMWPTVYEAIKAAQNDLAERAKFEDALKAILTMLAEADYGNDKHAQEDKDHSDNTPFPVSDLVITLPDDVYDKLMEKAQESDDSNGGGVTIRREHPKEDETKPEDSSSQSGESQSGESQPNQSGDQSSSSSGSADGQKQDGKQNSASGSGKSGNESGETEDSTGNSADGQDGKTSDQKSKSTSNSNSQGDAGSEQSGDQQSGGRGGKKSLASADDAGNARATKKTKQTVGSESAEEVAAIKKALKEAADSVTAKAEAEISTINQGLQASKAMPPKVDTSNVEDKERPLTTNDVAELMDGESFQEIKHENYRRIYDLPVVLDRRGQVLRNAVEKFFKSQVTPTVRNMRSGAIDARRLIRLAKNDVRVFQRKGAGKPTDVAVYILIDNSGSMEGAKTEAAFSAAAVQEEGFKNFAAMKITAFTTGEGVIHYTVKGWEEKHPWNACWNFLRHLNSGTQWGNEDEYDIRIATKELLKRPEKNKILIVLSDGTPGDCEATKKAIADARQKGVKLAGIYFEEGMIGSEASDFKDMYQRDYICCTTEEIDENLSRILHKFALS
jgi:cobalamin biosynthesis protein CobT